MGSSDGYWVGIMTRHEIDLEVGMHHHKTDVYSDGRWIRRGYTNQKTELKNNPQGTKCAGSPLLEVPRSSKLSFTY